MTAVNFSAVVERDGDTVIVRLGGELDVAVLQRAREVRDEALEGGAANLVIDLGAIDFIDSSGLKFLLETDRELRDGPCRLRIRRPGPAAMRVFTVTGADRHLPFSDV